MSKAPTLLIWAEKNTAGQPKPFYFIIFFQIKDPSIVSCKAAVVKE